MIARETLRAIGSDYVTGIVRLKKHVPIPIEVSAHHIHLCQEHVEALFGTGHTLTPEADLSQPGQFACKETGDPRRARKAASSACACSGRRESRRRSRSR